MPVAIRKRGDQRYEIYTAALTEADRAAADTMGRVLDR